MVEGIRAHRERAGDIRYLPIHPRAPHNEPIPLLYCAAQQLKQCAPLTIIISHIIISQARHFPVPPGPDPGVIERGLIAPFWGIDRGGGLLCAVTRPFVSLRIQCHSFGPFSNLAFLLLFFIVYHPFPIISVIELALVDGFEFGMSDVQQVGTYWKLYLFSYPCFEVELGKKCKKKCRDWKVMIKRVRKWNWVDMVIDFDKRVSRLCAFIKTDKTMCSLLAH